MILELVTLLVILALIGFAVYLIVTYVPMPEPFKKAIVVIVVLVLIIWMIRVLATGGSLLGR